MPIKVKPISDVAKKWGDVTPGRSSYYEAAATVAGSDWAAGATAAVPAYKAAITAANIGSLFAGGIKKAGADKYNRKVKDVGVSRFGPGVTAAVPDYTSGEGPMLDKIASLTLPARGPRGTSTNINRVTAIATELNKLRLAQRAAGA